MNGYTKQELAIIFLDSFEGLEYKHKFNILSLYDDFGDFFEDSQTAYDYIQENLSVNVLNTVKLANNKEYLQFIIENLNKKQVTAITYESKDYPNELFNYPLYPLVIYAKGNIDLLKSSKRLSIVGSRKTLPFVLKTTENIAKELSKCNVTIITGSAVGGDRSAILGSVESGNVISVLAHGFDYIYPESNRTLIEKVATNGLVITEYCPQTPSAAWRFPMRNRLIAALCNAGVLIVSGDMDSGTKHTAKFAEAYSKDIFCFPYSLGEKSGEICNMLIKLNKANLVENSEDIAYFANITFDKAQTIQLNDIEKLVMGSLQGETHIDQITSKTGKKIYELMPVLSMLEIKGAIVKNAGNTYSPLIKI